MDILVARPEHTPAILDVEQRAFGEPDEAELVAALLADPTAAPRISLVAVAEGEVVGHILFTHVELRGSPVPVRCMLLAPLAVAPEHQGTGVGQALMAEALRQAGEQGAGLVFVLGHPGYYPKGGFQNGARLLGFEPPFSIPVEDDDAWMVISLREGLVESCHGVIAVADALNDPQYWRE